MHFNWHTEAAATIKYNTYAYICFNILSTRGNNSVLIKMYTKKIAFL